MPGVANARRRLTSSAMVVMLALSLLSVVNAQASPANAQTEVCESLTSLDMPETSSIAAELVTSGTAAGETDLPEFCRVQVTVEPAINIEVWLPVEWNGRFQAVGGGGYAGVIRYNRGLAQALRDGYATAETDTGHDAAEMPVGSFGLNDDGTLNWQLIEDFASRSLVEMTKKSDALVEAFYGRAADYSYWNGCSTGGRQGLMLAQTYPDGYDGILAGAPAINWDTFIPAMIWPQLVMKEEVGEVIPQCKFEAANAAATAACDGLDGVVDGVLDDPRGCDFDVDELVGETTPCGVITEADARAIQMIWDGARTTTGDFLWYGFTPGTDTSRLAGPSPDPYPVSHIGEWVLRQSDWDWTELTYANFEEYVRESQRLFNDVIGTDDPDLLPFRDAGGRVLIWHGWYDNAIYPEGTIDYYERVIGTHRNVQHTQEFARLFMAPGVEHCGRGPGPNEFDMFGALVDWVENGEAPDRIIASRVDNGDVERARPLCPYPAVARYDGKGDADSATSFDCKPNYGRWGTPNNR